MTTSKIKSLIGAALVGSTMTIGAGSLADWGDPRGGPWAGRWSEPGWGGRPWAEPAFPDSGYGRELDRTHQRQNRMRDHRAAMQSVGRMLSGRRNFDRVEAVSLARQIEASAGENLAHLFQPQEGRRSPLSRARIGEQMEAFKTHAEALQQAAGELADQLEKQPGAEDVRAGRAWPPDWRRGGSNRSRWRGDAGALTKEVYDAYNNLRATCNGCHANFRTAWR